MVGISVPGVRPAAAGRLTDGACEDAQVLNMRLERPTPILGLMPWWRRKSAQQEMDPAVGAIEDLLRAAAVGSRRASGAAGHNVSFASVLALPFTIRPTGSSTTPLTASAGDGGKTNCPKPTTSKPRSRLPVTQIRRRSLPGCVGRFMIRGVAAAMGQTTREY